MVNIYYDSFCTFSHRVRFLLKEKDMEYKLHDVSLDDRQTLMSINPKNETPTMLDDIDKNNKKKDLILSDTSIICEYIDERFPHPQLMPTEPAERARVRMYIQYLEEELFEHVRKLDFFYTNSIIKIKKADADKAREIVSSYLNNIAEVFNKNKKIKFFNISGTNEFGMLDIMLLPLLWRVNYFGITPQKHWSDMMKYAETNFAKASFINSLTPAEKNMRK